jgi:hypothetical protein
MAKSEFPENPPERKLRVPTHPHPLYPPPCPKAMGMNPVKDAAQAGGAGYKLVSRSPFKRYAHENARIPFHSVTLRELCKMLHNAKTARSAAAEFRRRLNAKRDMSAASQADWKVFYTFFPHKPKAKPVRHRIF